MYSMAAGGDGEDWLGVREIEPNDARTLALDGSIGRRTNEFEGEKALKRLLRALPSPSVLGASLDCRFNLSEFLFESFF